MTSRLPEAIDCADEPIRVPGAIQPHGRLVVVGRDGRVRAFSENWPDRAAAADATGHLQLQDLHAGDATVSFGAATVGGLPFDVTGHRVGTDVVFEFESIVQPHGTASSMEPPLSSLARRFLPLLQGANAIDELGPLAVREMRRLTGFGRCLFYRFDSEGHGEVLAEEGDAGYDSYLGHHFPASDIPAQARALYVENHIRLIADANYVPVALVGTEPGWNPASLDLTRASLRSVSPVHLEYMRHMGTLASMSVSIVVRGRLWGLISCHDHAARHVAPPVRVACEHLARLLSMRIEAKEDNAEVASRLELRRLTLDIVSHLADSDASLQRIVSHPDALLALARATGAAVVLNEVCWSTGDVPDEDGIREIAAWAGSQDERVVHTDRLAEVVPSLGHLSNVAAGVLAISISQFNRHVILWFRPERLQSIQWAGDPRKDVGSDQRMHPRRSFASWREQIRGRSLAWSSSEVAAAGELREALIGIVLRRAEEMADAATELGKLNKELEAFSYTVSHDLRAPMRHISGYVDLVLESEGQALTDRAKRYLVHVKEASSYAGQLVDALLEFSRMGRSALKRRPIDATLLVSDLVRELTQTDAKHRVDWQVDDVLPELHGDPFLIQVAVRNLLTNAIKYSRDRDVARIRVTGVRQSNGQVGLQVTDNGVGFDMAYISKLFGVFQRLHHADEFEGTGIGLASVRRIVERHGGVVWAHGELNQGASFGFTVPLPIEGS